METSIRLGNAADIPFIMSKWMKEARYMDMTRAVPNDVVYGYHHKICEHIIPRSIVKIIYEPFEVTDEKTIAVKHPDKILAFLCCEPTTVGLVVHMAYTRPEYRRRGFVRQLVEHVRHEYDDDRKVLDTILYTHRTQMFRQDREWREYADKNFIHHFYLMFSTLPAGWEAS